MTATFSGADPIQSRVGCGAECEAVRTAARTALQLSSYAPLRRLRCEVTEAEVIVAGVLPSYYLKQMAQTVLQRLDGIRTVVNLVEVRAADTVGQAR
jgi:hypothetical protein